MDTSPTALFDSYEQDFKQIIQSIRDKLEGDGKDAQGGTYAAKSKPIPELISEMVWTAQSSVRLR